jgi:hypothetical protein
MFGHIDCVLIRWRDQFVAVPETAGGRERYIEVRGISDRDEAIALGEALLEAYNGTRGTTAVTGHVHNGSQQPGGAWWLGDKMDGQIIQSISVNIDDEGYTVVTPELGDPLRLRLDEMDRRIARAATPVQSEWASPYPEVKTADPIDTTIPTFTWRRTGGGWEG